MSLLERLRGGGKPPSTPNHMNQNPYEPAIPPAEGEERLKLLEKARKLLEKDMSPAVFNSYVDTMIRLLGTGEYSLKSQANSHSFFLPTEGDEQREIGFKRDDFRKRNVWTLKHQRNGLGRKFYARLENLSLDESSADHATDEADDFSVLEVSFDAPRLNLKAETYDSFVIGKNLDIDCEQMRDQSHVISLGDTRSFLLRTFELYSANSN